METQNVLAPSSTTDELIQIQSHESQLETPVPLHVGPERRVFFNDIVPKWMFWIIVFPMDGVIGFLRAFSAMAGFNMHWVRSLFFLILWLVQLGWEVSLMLYLNSHNHTSALRQWCAMSFTSFVLLGYELFSIWEVKNYPERYDKKIRYGSERALQLYQGLSKPFLYLALGRAIVFLTLMIFLVHVVRVYKANERIKREDEATP